MSARLHALLRAQRTVEAESGLAQLAERATQYFPVGATRNRYLLLHGIYGVRLRMLQQRYTECIRIGREADQLLRGALAVSPDDLFLLRTRFSVNAMHTCFPEPPASEEDKRFLEEALRHGIACAAKLAAKDSADARARVHWAEAESKLGQMLDGTGQRKAAIEALQNSVRLFQSTPSGEDRDVLALHYAAAERLVLVRVSIGQEAEALRVARTFLAMYLQALHIERLPPAEEVLDAHAHFWRAQKSVNRPLADQRRLWEQAAARAGAIAARFPQHSKEILVEYEKFKGQRR